MESAVNNTILGVSAANNGTGVYVTAGVASSSNNIFAGVTASNNSTGIGLNNTSNNTFTWLLQAGNNITNCVVTSGTNPGLNSDCTQQGSSNFGVPITAVSLANSFVGKVSTNDIANTSDINGIAAYPQITASFDWAYFLNPFRSWGKDGLAFPDISNRNKWTSGTGRIWDWSLLTADSWVRGKFALPTGNDTFTHIWNQGINTITFLSYAVEIIGDGIGNDNGLCESNETCLYTPNMGSYEGHGALISAGAFANGVLSGITLLRYQTNGY
jgi:hypothetical protein